MSKLEPTLKSLHQRCWERAGKWIKLAESLLDVEKTEKALEAVASLPVNDEDFDAAWRTIQKNVHDGIYRNN